MALVTSLLIHIIIPLCTCVKIGLPEDHLDTSSCFDRACISEHDWLEIGDKWQNFRETVKVMNDSSSADIRTSIWRTFQNGDIWNGNKGQISKDLKEIRNMRTYMDKRTEKFREVQLKDATTRYDHQAIIVMEGDVTVQKAAHFLYNKHPSVSTLYEYNPETDTLKVVAGEEHFLGEHSRVQIVGHGGGTLSQMRLSEKTPSELAEIVRKLPIEVSELGRVSLVGCFIGSEGQSEYLNDGFTEQFLKSLRFDQNIHTDVSSRNGLISVTASGRKETGEITADGIQWFSKDPLSKTIMTLGDFDEVIRTELPVTDRIATYNQESSGALVKLTDIDAEQSIEDNIKPIYIEKSNSDTGNREIVKKLSHGDIDEYINTITKNNFLNENDFLKQNIIDRPVNTEKIKDEIKRILQIEDITGMELVTQNMEKETVTKQKKEEGKETEEEVVNHLFNGELSLHDSKNNEKRSDTVKFRLQLDELGNLKMELSSNAQTHEPFYLDSGIQPNWKYVASLSNLNERVINVQNVRTIRDRTDLIYEVNMLGTFGVDYRGDESSLRYYRFGDMVYSMQRSNFYIEWEGMIASEDQVLLRHISDQQVNENEILHLNDWKWRDSHGRNLRPKSYKVPDYKSMMEKIVEEYIQGLVNQKKYARENPRDAKEVKKERIIGKEDVEFTLAVKNSPTEKYSMPYDSGNVLKLMDYFRNGEHSNIETHLQHVLEGKMVLAIGLSEAARNFRICSINEMLMYLNTIDSISVVRLIESHPMTRGGSWGLVGLTGLSVAESEHGPVQKEIVLPRELNIARRFLLQRKGQDETNEYRFLTETDYTEIEAEMPSGELAQITDAIESVDIQNTIADFRPEETEEILRTDPLGSNELPSVTDLEVFSDVSSGKALPIRASVAIINDYIFVSNQVSTAIAQRGRATGKEYDIIENSIEVEKGYVSMKIRDKANPLVEEELKLKIDDDLLTTNKLKKEASQTLEDLRGTRNVPSKSLTKVNEFLGVYGIVMGFRGAIQDFEDGKVFEGIMNVAQSVHGIYGMSQTAQRVFQKISSKLFSVGISEVETSLSAATTELSTALSEGTTAAEESLTVAGEAAEDIPVLGTIFGVYNTIQDLRRGTAIGYVDAALDAAIAISALFGPEALVVTVALTIVRLVIDDFYYAISNELKNLPSDATVLQTIGAVFKGIGEGIVMVLKNIVDFLSLGFLSFAETSSKIDRQYEKDHALLHKMSDFHNYFNIEKEEDSHEKLIDFASGDESWNGGNILFHLFDDNTARLRMQIVDDNGKEQILDKHIRLEEGADDIVLGIGESHDISFKKQSAKIFWFIPVHSRYLISKVRGERNTLHGTYYGNAKNNKFFTVQKLPEGAHLDYSLTDYFYEMYGEDGDDIFYLGPQKSVVNGGNGRDTYIIPYSGGRTEINNYAEDLKEDVLFMQVNFEQIQADRNGNDLILRHGHEHDVTVRGWYSGHRMGHLTFKANNGIIFNVTVGVYGKASIVPLAIVLTGDMEKHTIDVSRGIWKSVVMITGSDASDDIVANDNDNLLNGGKGYNTIEGGAGSDTYLLHSVDTHETSDWTVINNFDPKMKVDKVIFDIPYTSILTNVHHTDVQLYTNSGNGPKLLLKNWFSSEHFRHMIFVTTDDVIFKLADDINDAIMLHPIIIDASKEKASVIIDATKADFVNVSTIIGSDFNDIIVGNNGNNYIKGGKGDDTVTGGEGRDVYVIRQEDVGDFINNYAEDKKDDLILADFNYKDISAFVLNTDAILKDSRNRIVTIKNWMKGDEWRHITIRTIDGISFKLEKDNGSRIRKVPIEIDKSAKAERQEVMTHKRPMRKVEYIIGSNATDYLTGNQRANRIDPGFGGAYMMALGGHDQYVILDHYNGPNIVNNFARDNLTDTVKLPAYFNDVRSNVNGNDVMISSDTNPSAAVTLENYKTDPHRRHLVINTVKDGIVFTVPPSRDFLPTPISIDRTNQAHNLIVDLNSNTTWENVVTVVGTKEHSNLIRGNANNNTITGGKLSDTLEGGSGNDVIRGNEGNDFLDGGDGDDTLAGGAGDDWIDGGMGDDVIYPGPDADQVKGGPGFDVIVVVGDAHDMSGVFVDLLNGHGYGGDAHGDIYVSVEGVIGGFYSDILVGDHNDNFLDGKEGNDILFPLNGKDILSGGEGKDMYDIGNSEGEKVIRNKAEDEVMDYVNLKLYDLNSVYLERRADDLVLHVGVNLNGTFCPKLQTGPYYIEEWYQGTSFQHITIQLANRELVLHNFKTSFFEVHFERPDTEARKELCDRIFEDMLDYNEVYYDTATEASPEDILDYEIYYDIY